MKWIKFEREDGYIFYPLEKLKSLEIKNSEDDPAIKVAIFHFANDGKGFYVEDEEDFLKEFELFLLATDLHIFEIKL